MPQRYNHECIHHHSGKNHTSHIHHYIELTEEDRLEDQEGHGLENVEVVTAELEIDREDVHDRKKWRMNDMKRKPIGNR